MKILPKITIVSILILATLPLFSSQQAQKDLWNAIETSNASALQAALEAGANPNKRGGPQEMAPLSYAMAFSPDQIVEVLLAAEKTNVNKIAGTSDTPLLTAIRHDRPNIVTLLLANTKVNANKPNKGGDTPLMQAIKLKKPRIFRLLIEDDKVNLNMPDGTGETPLTYLIKNKATKGTQNLLDFEANPNQKNKEEETPLELAIMNNNNEIVQVLLHYKANPNQKNKEGETPLAQAIMKENNQIVQQLLNAGADPYIESNGKTALELAEDIGKEAIFATIEDAIRAKQKGTAELLTPERGLSPDVGPDVSRLIEEY